MIHKKALEELHCTLKGMRGIIKSFLVTHYYLVIFEKPYQLHNSSQHQLMSEIISAQKMTSKNRYCT